MSFTYINWHYSRTILTLCTLAFFVTMVGRLSVSPVVPEVSAEFDISNTHIGIALSGMWLAYAVTQYPSGALADKYGERWIILTSIAGTGLMSLSIVIAPNYTIFLIGAILMGGAAGLHYSVATTLLARTYDDLGTAVGVHNAGAPIAGLITPVIVAWVAVRYGWRLAVAVTIIFAIPVGILFLWRVRPIEPQHPDSRVRDLFEFDFALDILTRPLILYTGVIAIIFDFIWQATVSFIPTFFTQFKGYSTTTASVFFAMYFIFQGVLQIGVGMISDRVGRSAATALCTVSGIFGFILLIFSQSTWHAIIGISFLSLSMGWGATVLPRFLDLLPEEDQSAGFGLIRSIYMVFAATGSIIVGILADLLGWVASFGFLIGLLIIVGCMLIVNRILQFGY